MRGEDQPGVARPPGFDPFAPEFIQSPYGHYTALRDADPVHWSDLLHGWVITRYEDVAAVLRDPTMSSDIRRATPTPVTALEIEGLETHGLARETVVHMDDPDHSRVRRLMAPPFRVREVARLAPLVEQRVNDALDRLQRPRGCQSSDGAVPASVDSDGDGGVELDLVAEIAYPLPVEIFSAWLGMPEESEPQFRYWTSWVARSRDLMSTAERDELYAALDGMHGYLAEQAEVKRRTPADDLLSYLVGVGDGNERLSHQELMAQLITLYMAGHEPTAGLVGNGILALLEQPDQLERLKAEPQLVGNAVAELLRFDGPNQFVRRVTTSATPIGGRDLPAGEVLFVGLAAANRDPRRWGDSADSVVVDRPDADQHLQFGGGVHSCLGSHLARLQAERFLGVLLRRLDGLALAGEPVWSTRMFIRGLSSLPIRCSILP